MCVPPQSSKEYFWSRAARCLVFGQQAVRVQNGDRSHDLAVFLAEERHRAFLLGFVEGLGHFDHGHVGGNRFVDHLLDAFDLFGGHRVGLGEVEAQIFGRDERACLTGMVAEDFVQRLVQQMRGGVIAHDVVTAGCVHFGDGFVAHFGLTRDDLSDVGDGSSGGAAGGGDFDFPALTAALSQWERESGCNLRHQPDHQTRCRNQSWAG